MRDLRVAAILAALAMLLLLAGMNSQQRAPPSCPGCNVLIIMLDVLPASHVGAYGYWRNTTPNIDAFAARSWLFEKAISPTYVTEGGDAAVMFGESFDSDRLRNLSEPANYFDLKTGKTPPVSLQSLLGKSGYDTTGICSIFCTFEGGSMNGGFANYRWVEPETNRSEQDLERGGLDPFSIVSEELGEAKEPFFLFYQSNYLHDPYSDPALPPYFYPGYEGRMKNVSIDLERNILANGVYFGLDTGNRSWQLDGNDLAWVVARYDDKLRWMDADMGRLFKFLEDSGRLNDTIVIVSSEHGDELGGSEAMPQFGHSGISAQTVHVPLVVHMPDGGSGRVSRIVQLTDIYKTVLGSLGMAQEDGEARLGLFDGGRKYAFSFDFYPECRGGSIITEDGKRVHKPGCQDAFLFAQIDFKTGKEELLNAPPPAELAGLLEKEMESLRRRDAA